MVRRCIHIKDGKVTNISLHDDANPVPGGCVLFNGQCAVGWTYEDGVFSEPEAEPLSPEQIREIFKTDRQKIVDSIKVTTVAGNTFDGDETSQTRMARAIIGMQVAGVPSIVWVLADNSVIQASVAELTEAMVLAGQVQADAWVQA